MNQFNKKKPKMGSGAPRKPSNEKKVEFVISMPKNPRKQKLKKIFTIGESQWGIKGSIVPKKSV